jgi:ApaG protein
VPCGTDAEVLLEKALELATVREEYILCAQIRDQLAVLRASDPLLRGKRELAAAISAERWEDAAALRDVVKSLEPPPAPELQRSSSTVTESIRVDVSSEYLSQRSAPLQQQFLFCYTVRFTNESDRTVRLRSRYWRITDGTGAVSEVSGEGVVGQTPLLAPGETYAYRSFCPLRTPKGTMEGHFDFVDDADKVTPLRALCQRFSLSME